MIVYSQAETYFIFQFSWAHVIFNHNNNGHALFQICYDITTVFFSAQLLKTNDMLEVSLCWNCPDKSSANKKANSLRQ